MKDKETLEDVNDTIVPIKKVTIDELLKEYGKNLTESEFKILNNKINIKQETLEEAAEKYSSISFNRQDLYDGFIAGAKWQAERMYSKEEVSAIVEKSRETGLTAEYLLLTEQFKKK